MFKPHPEEFFPSDFEAVAAEAGLTMETAQFDIVEGAEGHDLVVTNVPTKAKKSAPAPEPAPEPTPDPAPATN